MNRAILKEFEQLDSDQDKAFFKTIAGPDAEPYPPEEDDPTVYYAQRIGQVTFTKTVGAQSISTALQADLDDFIFFEDFYLPVNSVVICEKYYGQWYVIHAISTPDESNKTKNPIRGTLNAPLASGGTAALAVSEWNGSAWVDSGNIETVHEIIGLDNSLSTGTVCVGIWFKEIAAYAVIAAKCP